MRFHRNIKMLRSQVDAAPFVTVFFLLIIFVLLGSLVYTPGVHVNLPVAADFPGTDYPPINVAVDAAGRLYCENQLVTETNLARRLRAEATDGPDTLTLVLHADREINYDQLIRVISIARAAGIQHALLVTLPRPYESAPTAPVP